MVIPMMVLIILVMFIFYSASDVKKTGTGGTNAGGDECEFFNVSLSIRGLDEEKLRIHASSSRHSRVCINDKRIVMTAEDQEQRFRGSIILTANDCTVSIILVILMLMK